MNDEKRDPPWQEQLLQALSQPPPPPREPSERERRKIRADSERAAQLARERLNAKRSNYRARRREMWRWGEETRAAKRAERQARRQSAQPARQNAEQIRADQVEAARKMLDDEQ